MTSSITAIYFLSFHFDGRFWMMNSDSFSVSSCSGTKQSVDWAFRQELKIDLSLLSVSGNAGGGPS